MKKTLLITSLLFLQFQAFSQISISRQHIAVAGRLLIDATHEGYYPMPVSGSNKIWDFTDLRADYMDSTTIYHPSECPGNSFFPGSNLAFRYSWDDSLIAYYKLSDSNMIFSGDYLLDGQNSKAEKIEREVLKFPLTKSSYDSDSNIYHPGSVMGGNDPDTAGPLPFIDSVQIWAKYYTEKSVTGWGTVKLPSGNFQALQQTEKTTETYNIFMFSNGMASPLPRKDWWRFNLQGFNTHLTYFSVNYYTNDPSAGTTLMGYSYNQGDTAVRDPYWHYKNTAVSSVKMTTVGNMLMYPNPVSNVLNITGLKEPALVKLLDSKGRVVMERILTGDSEMVLNDLCSGLYLMHLSLISNHSDVNTYTIIKE